MRPIRFIDLFAGLGGFHVGMSGLRAPTQCVFACEIAPLLRKLYEHNFQVSPVGDIRVIAAAAVPDHDVCCAGFPCQPFSKAGEQLGTDCDFAGDLFEGHLLRIIRAKKPTALILENVPNLERHNAGRTWGRMRLLLEKAGYEVDQRVLSPHEFGVPQLRERLFIVAKRKSLAGFRWPTPSRVPTSIETVLDENPPDARPIPTHYIECLRVWEQFLRLIPKNEAIPHPLWTMEFGATYPIHGPPPALLSSRSLSRFRGSYGVALSSLASHERMQALPSHAQVTSPFPEWKVQFIEKNRAFYNRNRQWLKPWTDKIRAFPSSLQKLEWNCKGDRRTVWDKVIQFRASGVRVKRPNMAPALVAMTTTQVPIIAAERRYMTVRECSRLQSLGALEHLPEHFTDAYRALGNAVNAALVTLIAESLLFNRSRSGPQGLLGERIAG